MLPEFFDICCAPNMFKKKHMIGIPSGFAGVVVGAECVFLWQQRPGAMAPAMHEDALRGEDAQLSTADSEVNKMQSISDAEPST